MISVSVCLSSQPDTAVQPAKERHSYTTCWDTIPGSLGNAGTRLLGLRYNPKLFLKTPTLPSFNPGDDLHLAGCL